MTEKHTNDLATASLRKKFPLSALSVAAAMPLLMLAGAAHSAGNGVDRNQSRQSTSESVKNFYAWTPAVTAANCPAGKTWRVPANGGVAFCAGAASPSNALGSGDSDFRETSGGLTPGDADPGAPDGSPDGPSSSPDGPAGSPDGGTSGSSGCGGADGGTSCDASSF